MFNSVNELRFLLPLLRVRMRGCLQMTRVSRERCLQIIAQYEPSDEGRRLAQLGIDGR